MKKKLLTLEELAAKNTSFSLRKHANLGGNVFGIETISPDSLRTNLLGLTRSARYFAQCFGLCALVRFGDLLFAHLTYRLTNPLTYH